MTRVGWSAVKKSAVVAGLAAWAAAGYVFTPSESLVVLTLFCVGSLEWIDRSARKALGRPPRPRWVGPAAFPGRRGIAAESVRVVAILSAGALAFHLLFVQRLVEAFRDAIVRWELVGVVALVLLAVIYVDWLEERAGQRTRHHDGS